jgi:hypothetical protein
VSGYKPTGDVGIVVRRNTGNRCRGMLFIPKGTAGGGLITSFGEHDSLIITDNVFANPRGGGSNGDTPKVDFLIKLQQCPRARIINNTATLYPIGASATTNTCIVLNHSGGTMPAGVEGTVDVVLANNITDFIDVNGAVTFATKRANTYRASDAYTPGTGDIQGTVTFKNPAGRRLHARVNEPERPQHRVCGGRADPGPGRGPPVRDDPGPRRVRARRR